MRITYRAPRLRQCPRNEMSMSTAYESLAGSAQSSLERWNQTATPYPRHLLAHQLFEEWVDRAPDAVALVVGQARLTYQELDHRANSLAHHLREKGVSVNDYVGICMHRSVGMIVSIIGVLKAGAAYVPLDASYPEKRLKDMMAGVLLKALIVSEGVAVDDALINTCKITEGELTSLFHGGPDNRPIQIGSPDSLAYLVFTSGSTGKAKAAKVRHLGWTNLLHWFRTQYSINQLDRVFVVSSFSFDITQRSIMMPLVCGGELHLLASRFFEPELIIGNVLQGSMTIINSAPSMLYAILEWPTFRAADLSSLRWVFLGGEPIVAGRLTAWVNDADCQARIANVYGVAECTDVSTAYTLVDFERYAQGSVPLGTPIFNSNVYLLDEEGNEVLPGEVGEICIGGDGVGMGYEGDDALTDKRFVSHRFPGGRESRLYRTGDLGKIGQELNLEYHGRVDHQVKIAGVRVELGDVETAIRSHPNVKDVVVIAAPSHGEMNLMASIVCKDAIDPAAFSRALREYLRERLPSPMLPSRVEVLAQIPLNPNGKADRKAIAERLTGAAP